VNSSGWVMPNDDWDRSTGVYIQLAAEAIRQAARSGDSHAAIELFLRGIDRRERAKFQSSRKPASRETDTGAVARARKAV
jgi:hypothetical protein